MMVLWLGEVKGGDRVFGNARKRFFFEKKKQKTFDSCGIDHGQRQMLQGIKIFLLLFVYKKKGLLGFLCFQTAAKAGTLRPFVP
jgi:hypothetical protein